MAGERLISLQAKLFPICETINGKAGFLSSFLSNSLKTNQLEVKTDSRTLRPIARLKEPRDLFALPKERENDNCSQQAPRWPTECQVLDERICHIERIYQSDEPEEYYQPTGKELQPRPVGEEGTVVFDYTPFSAVHYVTDSAETDNDEANNEQINDINELLIDSLSENVFDEDADSDFCSNGDDENEDENIEPPIELSPPNGELRTDIVANDTDTEVDYSSNNPFNFCDNNSWNDYLTASSRENSEFSDKTTTTPNDNNNNFDKNPFNAPKTITTKIKLDTTTIYTTTNLQFSRSSPGGSKYLLSVHPNPLEEDDLIFESRFESGNLARVVKITPTYYELYLRPDMYTNRHTQWFYFRVKNTRIKTTYRFSIINLTKPDSLYREGMRPLMYSTKEAETNEVGWRRCGTNIAYYRNEDNNYNNNNYYKLIDDFDEEEPNTSWSFTLTFNIEFQHADDTVFFAHSYPYTYSDLQDYLLAIQKHPVKSKFCKLRLLCRSLAGNNVYNLTVTSPSIMQEDNGTKKKKAIIMTARVHPGETPSSWMMKGFMDFITGDSFVAKKLRHKFIFKIIPMLNPDGVIVGNTRSSLTGRDLNRQYRTVIRETYPSIWNTKAMIKRLMEDCGVALYCDMHAHSRKHNIFIYGCENLKRHPDRRLLEQVFPLMLHKNVADKFSFENCKFRVQKTKEGCGRIVVWVLGVTNSYTLEASFAGSTMGSRNGTHFAMSDYEHIGRAFCETLMDFYDDSQTKEKLRNKILTRLFEEGSNSNLPKNIPLSDYSSDEGETSSSSSENEGKDSKSDYEGPCCQPLKVPPSSPVLPMKMAKNMKKAKNQNKSTKNYIPRRPRKCTRQVMDIPSTDPGSDFFDVSTDEEFLDGDTDCLNTRFSNRLKVRSTDASLKSIATYCESQTFMPPELIVTSAKDSDTFIVDSGADNHQNIIRDFPPLNKRTRSWHNLNRCMSTTRIKNLDCSTAENLQMKLSLKKQVWTGSYTGETSIMDITRPLSWGNSKTAQSFPYDCDTLLAACSRKLGALQVREQEETKQFQKISDLLKNSARQPRIVVVPPASANLQKPKEIDGLKPKLLDRKNNEYLEKNVTGFLSKSKKRTKTTFSKTDILTQLTKTTQSFGFKRREPMNRETAATAQKANKFKAAQIAVTAVQTKKKAKSNTKLAVELQIESNTTTIGHPAAQSKKKNRPKRSKSKEKKAKVK